MMAPPLGGSRPHSVQRGHQQQRSMNDMVQAAESRVDGLLQELEDLRFLEELEKTEPPPNRSQSVPRAMPNTDYPGYLKTPRGDTIPAVIRAISPPPHSRRLPPPERSQSVIPPRSNNSVRRSGAERSASVQQSRPPERSNSVQRGLPERSSSVQRGPPERSSSVQRGLPERSSSVQRGLPTPERSSSVQRGLPERSSSVQRGLPAPERSSSAQRPPQSRYVAKQNDRLTPRGIAKLDRMELELEVQTLVRKVEVLQQEKLAVEQEVDIYRLSSQDHGDHVQSLERNVLELNKLLEQRQRDWDMQRTKLITEHETTLARQRQSDHDQITDLEQQLERVMNHAEDVEQQLLKQQTKVESMALDLQEAQRSKEQMQTTLRSEQERLNQTIQSMETKLTKEQRNSRDEYELKLSTLQEELNLRTEQAQAEEQDYKEQLRKERSQTKILQEQTNEQSQLIEQMTQRLDAVHEDYREKFAALKGAYERKEHRRAEETVKRESKLRDEYEQRITALQEQLSHQTDRHQVEVESNVESALERQRTQLESTHASQLDTVRQEHTERLARMQQQMKEAEHEVQQMKFDRENQEATYAAELARLRENSERLLREVSIKDADILELQRQLQESERSHEDVVLQLKQTHQQLLQEVEETSSTRLRSIQSSESTVKNELARKEREYREQKSILERKMADLANSLDEVQQESQKAHKQAKATESNLRLEITKLEGKIRATEETAKQRRAATMELEEQLDMTLRNAKERESQIHDLEIELETVQSELESEREQHGRKVQEIQDALQEKDDALVDMERQLTETSLREKSALERAEERENVLREAQTELISERSRHAKTEDQIRADVAILQGKLKANEKSLSEKRETIEELEEKLRSIADQSSSANRELQRELDRIRDEASDTKKQLDTARADLFAKEDIVKQKERKINESTKIIRALEGKVVSLTKYELDVNQNIKDLGSSLEQCKKDLSSERNRAKAIETSLNDQISNLKNEVSHYESEVKKLTVDRNHAQESLKEAEEKLASLIDSRNEYLQEVQDELDQTKLQLIDAKQTADAKADEINRLEEELQRHSQVARSFEVSRQSEEQLKLEMVALREQVQELENLLEAEKKRVESSVSEFSAERSSLERQLREHQSSIEGKNNSIKDLTAKLEAASKELENYQDHHREALENANYTLSFTKQQLSEQRAAAEAKTEALKKVQEDNRSLTDQIDRLNAFETKVMQLEKLLDQAKERHSAQESEIERLQRLRDKLPSTTEFDELQRSVDSERKSKLLVVDELSAVKAEARVNQQLVTKLQSDISTLTHERDELAMSLRTTESKLARTESELNNRSDALPSDESNAELSRLRCEAAALAEENESLKDKIHFTMKNLEHEKHVMKVKLGEAEKRAETLNQQLTMTSQLQEEDTQRKIDLLTRSKATLEQDICELKLDMEEREKHVKESNERYSNEIVALKVQVGNLSHDNETLKASLKKALSELEEKESKLSGNFTELQTKLCTEIATNEDLRRNIGTLRDRLSEFDDIKRKLESESREKRSLVNRIGDMEDELRRKVQQLDDVVSQYSKEIAELNRQLEAGSTARQAQVPNEELAQMEQTLRSQQVSNARLQREIDILRGEADKVDVEGLKSEVKRLSGDNEKLQDKLKAFENEKETRADETDAEKSERKKLEEKLKKAIAERAEVVNALEEVLNEVQDREYEIDTLEGVLRKRDEELEHAKLIAAKALASAQEIKSRFKVKGNDRSEMSQKIAELQSENEKLRRQCATAKGESRTKSRNRKLDGFMEQTSGGNDINGFPSFDDEGFPSAAFEACSPTQADSLAFNDTMSTQSGELQAASSWLAEFGRTDSAGSLSGTRTEASDSQSVRSNERDRVPYYNKRYMKARGERGRKRL